MLRIAGDGVECEVVAIGASLAGLRVPDRDGVMGNVVLSLPDEASYADRSLNHHLGAFVGRYANRIAGATFAIDGSVWHVDANEGPNCLHGGRGGWGHREWDVVEHQPSSVTLRLVSDHLDQGFPGRVEVTVRYAVRPGELRVDAVAVSDAPTVVSMTHHPYWNLAADGTTIDRHELAVPAVSIVEVDAAMLPTGRFVDVPPGTFDGSALGNRPWDACLLVGAAELARPVAVLSDPASGRRMEVRTAAPGVQVYTADGLSAPFGPRRAVCLEAQLLPDAVHHPQWPYGSPVLRPGETARWSVTYGFGIAPR